jgi:hypothetical protein
MNSPEEKKFAVVFDTNSYRQFVNGKTREQALEEIRYLKHLENNNNIKAFGLLVVGMEMLGNLVEGEGGFNFTDCKNGIEVMSNHCFDEAHQAPRIIPQPYLHISRAFFSTVQPEAEQNAKNMGGVINDFRIDSQQAVSSHHSTGTFNNIKNYIDQEEANFAVLIEQLIDAARQAILKKHPNIAKKDLRIKLLDYIQNGSFEPSCAMAMIIAVAQKIGTKLEHDTLIEKAMELNLELPLSVGFYTWICHKIVNENIDMQSKASREKRWNWQWDYQVSFLMSPHTINDRELILVTSDKDIINMLHTYGYRNKVATIQEYISLLKPE